MKYLGGKHGIGKLIAEFLTKECPPDIMNGYLEPFCGSLGVFKNMTNKGYQKYIASDIQPDLIQMWKQLQKKSLMLPNTISEKEYNNLKNAKSPNALKAVAAFGLSFGGKYFAGYAQKWAGNSGRNFFEEFKTSIKKIQPLIINKNITFFNKSYSDFKPNNMLIYCDPPYKFTQGYSTGDFDHDAFWETMRNWSKNNCVFISEETAPNDFKVVWKRKKRRTLDKENRFHSYEKIYQYSGVSKFKKTKKNKNIANKTRKNKK